MALNHFVASFVLLLFFSSCALQAQASITITSNSGSSAWWLAFAISDPTTTKVELKDSGSYASWTALQSTNWGYWTFATTGNAVTFPISFRLSQGTNQLTITNAFSSAAPGQTYDTKLSFPATSGGTSTQAPTTAPTQAATPKPTTAPATAAPTPKPTTAPATAAPTTKPTTAPATAAPTTKPTTAPTTKPTTAPATAAPTTKPTTAPTTKPTTAPTSKPVVTGNPFSGTYYYLNPEYSIEIDSSIAANPSMSAKFTKVKNMATAYWLDTMQKVDNLTTILTQARQQASTSAAGGKSVLVTLVVYDLPARDCAAGASNGEISCADATCAAGISTYKTQYIDKLVAVLRNFPDLTIATIIEPDSLPNLATNLGYPKCALAQTAYTTCVAYAIQQLSSLSNVHNYIDAAHGGWLGWDSGRNAYVTVVSQVIAAAGGKSKIRGFATNVANYQPLGSMTDTTDPCNLGSQYNFAINEVKYANLLDQSLIAAGITGMYYIIDTGRNGVPNSRTSCSNWCNIEKAGFGQPPSSNTAASGLSNIDAYFWIKPGGESDGTSDATSARYDATCSSVDSMVPAPQAGAWFSNYFASLATNANPAL